MANDIVIPANFGPMSQVFADRTDGDELSGGIVSGFGVVGYRGKVWSIKYQGNELPLMREDGDGPRASIEVIVVRAAGVLSKIFYASGYTEGSSEAPDCWSTNGVTPDAGVPTKVSSACLTCPNNAWGSRVTEQGKSSKACSDSKRIAIVPTEDMDNELFGGPLLLRIPAASLKDLKAYGDKLSQVGYKYYAVSTRISFDVKDAYPHLVFNAVRPLTDEEALKVLAIRDEDRVIRILSENEAGSAAPEQAPAAQAGVFEQGAPAQAPAPQPTKTPPKKAAGTAAQKTAPTPTAAPVPVATPAPTPAPKTPAQLKREELERQMAELAAAEEAEAYAAAASPPTAEVVGDEMPGREASGDGAAEEGMEDFDAMLDGLLQV